MAKQKEIDPKSMPEISVLLDMLTSEQKELLRANYVAKHYKKNELIYEEGEIPVGLLCVVEGKVKVYKKGVGGRAQIVRILKPVEFFGYRAFLAEERYVTSAMAFEPATILTVPGEIFLTLVKENSKVAFYFVKALAIDLGIADSRTVTLTQNHIRGRLAESLLFMKDSYGLEEDGATISVYLSREDLANLSNMTTSNAIRTLTSFIDEKVISVDGRKIKIINEEGLKKIARFG
jgi:CRP-like cAMP-binding protein